jgi:hypothetical protein
MDEAAAQKILKMAGLMDGKPTAPRPRQYTAPKPAAAPRRPVSPGGGMMQRSLGRGLAGAATLGVGGFIASKIKGMMDGTGATKAPGVINNALAGKQGSDDALLQAATQAVNSQVKQQALSNIMRATAGGLGLGAAAAGVGGLLQLRNKPLKYQNQSNFVSIPYPVQRKKQEEPPTKMAGGMSSFLAGDQAATPAGVPWHYPGLMAGGVGGALAGYSGVKSFLLSRKRKEQERELANAESAFQKSMLEQYDAPLKVALDALYDKLVATNKLASLADALGQGVGLYGSLGLLTGAAGASVGYGLASRNRRRKVLNDAMRARMRQRFAQSPPEIVAVPTPVERIPQLSAAKERQFINSPETV